MAAGLSPGQFELASRKAFNKSQRANAKKSIVPIGRKQHEFDLYEPSVIAGGISTSSWRNKTGTNNTGGQDRVTAELLWLHLCSHVKRKVLILRDKAMAQGITDRFGESNFFNPRIEIWVYDETKDSIARYSDL